MVQTGFRWERPPEQALSELTEAYVSAIHRGVHRIAQAYAPDIEDWMKDPAHAIWKDRSGNARQTLYTEVRQVVESMVELILSHGVEYGVYLELNNAGKYAVIDPAIDHWAPILWSEIVRMLS
jgi:hypothetical protein